MRRVLMSGLAVALVSILAAGVQGVSRAAAAAPSRDVQEAADAELARAADDYLERLALQGFAGGVFVARDGQALLKQAYGLANRAAGTAMTTQAVMTTGSLTKQFTGAAIALLEHEGLVDLDDSLADFFDEVPEDKHAITVRHLLTHTAGLPGAVGHDWDLTATREWLLETALARELASRPGANHHYSNVGYSLLAMIVEEVSGLPYEEFVQERLFLPAGMEHTGMVLADQAGMLFPTGYRGGEEAPTFVDRPMLEDGPSWNLRGNGGMLSTLEDLFLWCRVLDGEDDVLPAAVRAKLDAPLYGSASGGYGYGWGHETRHGTHLVEHDGGNTVFSADIHRFVDRGLTLCVLSSVAERKAFEVIDAVEALVFGQSLALPPAVVPASPEELARCAGVYGLEDGETITVVVRGGELELIAEGPTGCRLIAGQEVAVAPERARAERTCLAALRALARGDAGPFLDACAPGKRAGRFQEALAEELQRASQERGTLDHVALLPPLPEDPGGVWLAACHEQGEWCAFFEVGPEGIVNLGLEDRVPAGLPGRRFLPVGDRAFESFALAARSSTRVVFTGEALRFLAPSPVEARRLPEPAAR